MLKEKRGGRREKGEKEEERKGEKEGARKEKQEGLPT